MISIAPCQIVMMKCFKRYIGSIKLLFVVACVSTLELFNANDVKSSLKQLIDRDLHVQVYSNLKQTLVYQSLINY
jgi:hypothetical protein